jgi:hypothetical protein
MPFPFLSSEWMDASRQIRERHAAESTKIATIIRMNQVITDAPFGGGTLEVFLDTSSGDVVLDYGQLDAPDLTLTTDYVTARKIFVDQDAAAGMQAFMAGKVRVQGDMMKMMALQTAMPSDDIAKQIAGEIQAITE